MFRIGFPDAPIPCFVLVLGIVPCKETFYDSYRKAARGGGLRFLTLLLAIATCIPMLAAIQPNTANAADTDNTQCDASAPSSTDFVRAGRTYTYTHTDAEGYSRTSFTYKLPDGASYEPFVIPPMSSSSGDYSVCATQEGIRYNRWGDEAYVVISRHEGTLKLYGNGSLVDVEFLVSGTTVPTLQSTEDGLRMLVGGPERVS